MGRNSDVVRFISLIQSIEGSYSIFLDAPWGEGKTFFVKSVEAVLKSRNSFLKDPDTETFDALPGGNILDKQPEPYLPFYFNAWENDHYGDPLCPLLADMASQYDFDTKTDTASFSDKAVTIIDMISGIASLGAMGIGQTGFSNALNTLKGKDLLDQFKERKELRSKFDELIESVLPKYASKMILFIDELDRCNPLFSLRLLEQTKRLFANDNVILVYSVDSIQLANAIAGAYGNQFDGKKYLERFYDMRFELTPVDKLKYLDTMGYGASDSYYYAKTANDYIAKSVFTMRDLNRICRRLREGQKYIHSFERSGTGDYPSILRKMHCSPLSSSWHTPILPYGVGSEMEVGLKRYTITPPATTASCTTYTDASKERGCQTKRINKATTLQGNTFAASALCFLSMTRILSFTKMLIGQ